MFGFQHLYVCLHSASSEPQIHSTFLCCLLCWTTKDWKSSATCLKLLVSVLVTFLLLKFLVKITWQYPASYDNVSMSSLAWIYMQELFCSSSSAYCCLKGISSKQKVFKSCLHFLPFSPSALCLLGLFSCPEAPPLTTAPKCSCTPQALTLHRQ